MKKLRIEQHSDFVAGVKRGCYHAGHYASYLQSLLAVVAQPYPQDSINQCKPILNTVHETAVHSINLIIYNTFDSETLKYYIYYEF